MAQCRSPFALSGIVLSGLAVGPSWGLIRVNFNKNSKATFIVGNFLNGIFDLLGLDYHDESSPKQTNKQFYYIFSYIF